VKWTSDIVVRLEAAAEDVDVMSVARLETLLREAVCTIRALRAADGTLDADAVESH
jgi:hypothetical protein